MSWELGVEVIRSVRIIQRNALVYRRVWRGSLFFSFLQPTLFLIGMGVGVGTLVDRGGTRLPGDVGFLRFLAPGLLAAACMQTASFESSYPIAGKITWQRNYEAILSTPIRILDVVLGELGWIAIRLAMVAVAFVGVMLAFDIPRSPLVILAIPAAVLTGLAFSAPIIAYSATLKSGGDFNVLFRFGITPLFLFSGVFFPITRLPDGLRPLAWLTPLFHGVELVRGLTLNTLEWQIGMIHLTYLAAMMTAGIAAAGRTFERKLRA
jgi:lipooligosaccharide transport system permease protein